MRRSAFSLIELSVVLVIMALIAAVVTLRIQGPLATATESDVADRIRQFDHVTREQARRQGRELRIVFDGGAGQLRRTTASGSETVGQAFRLPGTWRIARVVADGGIELGASVGLAVSAGGLSCSYAVRIEDDHGRGMWIGFAGLTGEAFETDDDERIQDILGS